MIDVAVESGALAKGGDVHGEVRLGPAGSGANAAVWAAHDGAGVRLYGRVGNDLAGRLIRDALLERGVEAVLVADAETRTGTMLVVREAGERSMVADRGANARVSPADLPDEIEAGAILVSGYLLFHPDSEPAAMAALERGRAPFVAIDAASWPLLEAYGAERFLEATSRANVLLANEREATALFGPDGEGRASAPYEHVVLKRGPAGARYLHVPGQQVLQYMPSSVDQPVDPTGAGDAFGGVFLAALARGAPWHEALRRGCEAGARAAASPETWPEA